MNESRSYYRRNLPHWHPSNAAIFLTCRLYGSLPQNSVLQLRNSQILFEREIEHAKNLNSKIAELRLRHYKKLFARVDAILDKAEFGPRWLSRVEIAELVERAILKRYAELYQLWAYVVMSNHIHLLLRPKSSLLNENCSTPLSTITKGIKGYVSREANLILNRTGERFWQQESFDHWPRDRAEFYRIIAYIENNPVKAGLLNRPEDWRWSSAAERMKRGWNEIRPLT